MKNKIAQSGVYVDYKNISTLEGQQFYDQISDKTKNNNIEENEILTVKTIKPITSAVKAEIGNFSLIFKDENNVQITINGKEYYINGSQNEPFFKCVF